MTAASMDLPDPSVASDKPLFTVWGSVASDKHCLAPAGLIRKHRGLQIDGEAEAVSTLDLATLRVQGAPRIEETLFWHRPSNTLIVTDLLFHVLKPRGLLTGVFLSAVGVRGRLEHSRVWRGLVQNRAAFRESLLPLAEWRFEGLLPAHGTPIDTGARAPVLAALRDAAGAPSGW